MRIAILSLAVILVFGSIASAAEKMPEPTADYSADMLIQTEQGQVKSRVYHAVEGKERHEMRMGEDKGSQTIIVRIDKNLSWLLMPEHKMYMETGLKDSKGKGGVDVKDCAFDTKEEGSETVNGVRAAKKSIKMSCPDKVKYEGAMWVAKENIMVKMDAVASDKDSKHRIKIDLDNLKVGKQDPALFEIPEGYNKMGLKNMLKGARQSEPEEQPKEQEPSETKEQESPADDSAVDKAKKMKKLFKW